VRDVVIDMGLLTSEQLDKIMTPQSFRHPVYTGRRYEPGERELPERTGAEASPGAAEGQE